ncbi:competence protein CoiA family protein [Paraburkholderia azotifigens]|uniref:competence protein CoiA family protein n=1 Tax=Paraburkholderia azotifigens TaxID=2057004 RepID=UPI00317DB950
MTIPFALNALGHVVAARDLPKQAPSPFRCAACQKPVTLKQGKVRAWHFSHLPGSDCTKGFETALHLLAKQILVEHRHLRAPSLVSVDETSLKQNITLCDEHVIHWAAAGETEKWMDGIRPDFVADCGEQLLIVEVVVTHEHDDNKLAQLNRLAMPALEIDLSDVARDATTDMLTHRIIDTVEGKRWLFYPGWAAAQAVLADRRREEVARLREEEARRREEAEARHREEEAQLAEEEAEMVAEYAKERAAARREHTAAMAQKVAARRRLEQANERYRQATDADKRAYLAQKLGLPEDDWPELFGSKVRWASAVKTHTRIWQADVFRRFIHRQRGKRAASELTVAGVAEWLTQRYNVLPSASTSLPVAVWDFLSLLEQHGYLRRRPGQEFEILKDVLPEQERREPTHPQSPAAVATRGLRWSRDFGDEMQIYLAAEQNGVRPEATMQSIMARVHLDSVAEYTHRVSVELQLPLGQTVEFLMAAGFLVHA